MVGSLVGLLAPELLVSFPTELHLASLDLSVVHMANVAHELAHFFIIILVSHRGAAQSLLLSSGAS